MIKKTFFDLWDNLLVSVALNIGFIMVLAIPVLVPPRIAPVSGAVAFLVFFLGFTIVVVYAGVVSIFTREMTDYRSIEFRKFGRYLRDTVGSSLVLALIWILHLVLLGIGLPVYAAMESFFGMIAMVLLFWAAVLWSLASQYYLPIRARLDSSILKILKKSFLLLLDNPGFTVSMAIGLVIIIVLSISTPFFLVGFPAAMIWLHTGLKLRLLKYDYLEQNPDADRRRVPWSALLIEEKEKVGKRTLKGLVFPWKE